MFLYTNSDLPEGRFIYAGDAYFIKGGELYREYLYTENGATQLGGFFSSVFKGIKKAVKSVGKVVTKVAGNPLTGIALATVGGSLLSPTALTWAKVTSAGASIIQQKQSANQTVKQINQAQAQNTAVINNLNKQLNAQGTQAAQAYANYLAAGNQPVIYGKAPDVTNYGNLTVPLLIGAALIGVALIVRK